MMTSHRLSATLMIDKSVCGIGIFREIPLKKGIFSGFFHSSLTVN